MTSFDGGFCETVEWEVLISSTEQRFVALDAQLCRAAAAAASFSPDVNRRRSFPLEAGAPLRDSWMVVMLDALRPPLRASLMGRRL